MRSYLDQRKPSKITFYVFYQRIFKDDFYKCDIFFGFPILLVNILVPWLESLYKFPCIKLALTAAAVCWSSAGWQQTNECTQWDFADKRPLAQASLPSTNFTSDETLTPNTLAKFPLSSLPSGITRHSSAGDGVVTLTVVVVVVFCNHSILTVICIAYWKVDNLY